MPPQTLKRQAEDVSFRNDDLVDDVYNNEKWGSKKSRFHYTSSLQSESNLFKNINDSDQAESGHSFQSTIEVVEKLDFSSDSSCENDSNTDYSCQSCSSHSDITDFEVSKNVVLLSNDNGYLPEDSIDIKLSTPETKVLYPCFKTCLMCKKNNTNPFFQFCNKCFRYRMQLFESYPDPQPKSIKRLNIMVNHAKESNVHKASSTSNSQGSGSFELKTDFSTTGKLHICTRVIRVPN
ncbi:uncharacterized protein LOC112683357 isoform X2 [Sipha flava]|uniref:Uncharacterized protein LOC112683357 isoform X2 n=1 Tax=Sipha flava TaxID=143950 RepID=A0A8B8FHW7_9HEMI|nr:uncharacterized protein LOC112683357 isoform X2 [Sipha flava]